jgi:hypothetical protein
MKARIAVLVAAAMVPFGVSLVPPLYVLLVYYVQFTYLVGVFCGMIWTALFLTMYVRAEIGDRRKLRWYLPLSIFAFIKPAHWIMLAIGVPPFLPPSFTPSCGTERRQKPLSVGLFAVRVAHCQPATLPIHR